MQYTKDQCEERVSFYTEKLEHFKKVKPGNLHNISVYENLLKLWQEQIKKSKVV